MARLSGLSSHEIQCTALVQTPWQVSHGLIVGTALCTSGSVPPSMDYLILHGDVSPGLGVAPPADHVVLASAATPPRQLLSGYIFVLGLMIQLESGTLKKENSTVQTLHKEP